MKFWSIIILIIAVAAITLMLSGQIIPPPPMPTWEVAEKVAKSKQEIARAEMMTQFMGVFLFWIVPGLLLAAIAYIAGSKAGELLNHRYELQQAALRSIDGKFQIIKAEVEMWDERAQRMRKTIAVLDVNALITGQAVLDVNTGCFREPVPAAGFDAHLRIATINQAMVAVAQATSVSTQAMIAQADAMADAGQKITIHNKTQLPPAGWAKQQLALMDKLTMTPAPAAPAVFEAKELDAKPITWEQALDRATPTRWPIGYNAAPFIEDEERRICWFDLERDTNLGIPGINGSGKTITVLNMLYQALKGGMLGLLLDGKEGVDLEPFAPYCEWQPCTPKTVLAQVNALEAEYERRARIIGAAKCNNIGTYQRQGGTMKRVFIVLEEFNAVWDNLATNQRGEIAKKLGTIINRSRFVGYHFAVLAQQPAEAPEFIRNNVFGGKSAIFRLGPSQAGFMAANEAQRLDRQGQFLNDGIRYYSWDVGAVIEQRIKKLPLLDESARILPPITIDGILADPPPTTPAKTTALVATTPPPAPAVAHPEVSDQLQEMIDDAAIMSATGTRLDPSRFDGIMQQFFAADEKRWGDPNNITGDDARPLARLLIAYDKEHYGLERDLNTMASSARKLLLEWRTRHWESEKATPISTAPPPPIQETSEQILARVIREQHPEVAMAGKLKIHVIPGKK